MSRENNEEGMPAFADNILRRNSSKRSCNAKLQRNVEHTKFDSLVKNISTHDSKVPLSDACSESGRFPLNVASHSKVCIQNIGPKYVSDRKIAYVEMSRTADGSTILLEDCGNGEGVIPGWDHVEMSPTDSVVDANISSCNFNDLNNLNYADIDFIPTQIKPCTYVTTSFRTKYACIDFSKTLAIQKTGKEHLQERNTNVSCRKKTSTSSVPLKKASSCFYVSTPTDCFDCSDLLLDKNNLSLAKSNALIKIENQLSLSPKPQRKFSLDFVDSSGYPNTLPHSKKKYE